MSKRVAKEFFKPSLTKQSFRDECDINKIMQRFKKTMNADFLTRFAGYTSGEFGDFSNVGDYRSAIDQVTKANEVFMNLPAKVRSRFRNDAASFLDFCNDPRNVNEMVDLGLVVKRTPSNAVDQSEKKAS